MFWGRKLLVRQHSLALRERKFSSEWIPGIHFLSLWSGFLAFLDSELQSFTFMQLGIHLSSGCMDVRTDNPDKSSFETAMRPISYEGTLPVYREVLDLARNGNLQQSHESSWPASLCLGDSVPALLDLPPRCMVCGWAVCLSSMGAFMGNVSNFPITAAPPGWSPKQTRLKMNLCP